MRAIGILGVMRDLGCLQFDPSEKALATTDQGFFVGSAGKLFQPLSAVPVCDQLLLVQ